MNNLKVIFFSQNKSLKNWCFQVLGGNVEFTGHDYWNFADFLFIDFSIVNFEIIRNLQFLLEVYSSIPIVCFNKAPENADTSWLERECNMSSIEPFTETGALKLKNLCSSSKSESDAILTFESAERVEKKSVMVKSSVMEKCREQIINACNSDETVLLVGESGSGKSFYASYIHNHSARSGEKFVRQNCAELTPSIFESQLFGTEAGAYTDAIKRKGVILAADKGTFFMDEIGVMPYYLQPKILSVIETQNVRPLGSCVSHKVDVRFIFATNDNLKKMVNLGTFRKDLYYRIHVLEIEIPALRKHKEDIPELAMAFAKQRSCNISKGALEKLMDFDWPGNVRQLENEIKRACSKCTTGLIEEGDLF